MIVTRTYLSKTNTIVRDCPVNTGLNPILELNYGKMMSRGLIYFDHSKIKKMVDDCTYPDITRLTHVLHIHNAASFNDLSLSHRHECLATSQFDEHKQRAVSFDVLFFLIPQDWDAGIGFDYIQDVWREGKASISTKGSNWYKSDTLHRWPEEGIYSTDYLSGELDKATLPDGNKSKIIIGWQHFDFGNEDICFDITETVNKFITGELDNHGIGIAFFPSYENSEACGTTQYVGFHTQHTHSFFEPYVESTYNEELDDSRANFYLDKENKLYFYANVGGKPVNLDILPKCEINGVEYTVKQATKGVYYVEVLFESNEYEPETMYYDTWSNIIYRGRTMPDVELDFTTKSEGYFSFGLPSANTPSEYIPTLSGISHMEKVPQGDIRKILVDCRAPYTSNSQANVDGVEYRLYVWMGDRQIDIIDWRPVERGYNEMFFLLETESLVPFRYNIDIRVNRDKELTYHKDMLTFDIVNNYSKQKN